MRGLYAPPRSSVAPARWAIRAASSVCSGVSTAQGPAMRVKVSGPIGTPPTRMVLCRAAPPVFWADTSLYGAVIRIVSATPGSPPASRVSRTSSVPTTPTIVRITPRLTNACPPWASMCETTSSMSEGEAPGAITMTIGRAYRGPGHSTTGRGRRGGGAVALQGRDVDGLIGVGGLDHHRHAPGGRRGEQRGERRGADGAAADALVPVAS